MTNRVSPQMDLPYDQNGLGSSTHVVGPKTDTFQSSKGNYSLHCSYWAPANDISTRGLAFLCHGFGEHLQWYEDLALKLADLGVFAFGHDHIGHGRSEGVRGHITSVEEYVDDVLTHCRRVKKETPDKPLFIIGHSMGGLIAIRSVMISPETFKGAVLMGPLIRPHPDEATPFRIAVAKVISKMLPLLPVGKLNVDLVTRDDEMRKKLTKDPLRYRGGIRARWAMACFEELGSLSQELEDVNWPFLILHGENDKLCQPEASKDFYKKARSFDKKLKVFPDAYHHLYLEIPEVRREALEDTVNWVEARLPAMVS